MKVLIEAHANVNEKLDSNDFVLLHLATQLGFVDTVELLLKAGAKLDSIDKNGHNALHRSAYSRERFSSFLDFF